MSKKHKKSSTATDDDYKTKKRKISSTASNVDTAHASSSKSLESVFLLGKRVLEACSEINVNLKELEKHKDIKPEETEELTKSIKELTTTIKQLQETLRTKPDLLEVAPLKEEENDTLLEEEDTCCFDCEEAKGNNGYTIFVKGFENLRPRNEIKKMLSGAFGQCGEITRVFVPIECKTGLPLGFAFINFKFETGEDAFEKAEENLDKAFKLNGCLLEGRRLEVTIAKDREEYYGFTNFGGCQRCRNRRIWLEDDTEYSDYSISDTSDEESP